MKYRFFAVIAALLALTALSGAPLTIFYTGDTHGVFESKEVRGTEFRAGGYPILEEVLNRERQVSGPSVWLDSGDQQTGSIFASLVEDGVHGGAVIGVFNRLGLDAATFGNHEFDFSYANARDLAKAADYDVVSTNLLDKATRQSVSGKPYAIIERDGLRVGVFGITLELLPEKVKAENVRSVRILPPADAINQYLDEVDLKSDLIVVLSHQGWAADSLLATQLDDRVDIIIGGHDHLWLDEPALVNGKYLLYSGSHLNYLGKAVLDVVDDRVVSLSNTLLPLVSSSSVQETPLSGYISDRVTKIQAAMSRVMGNLPLDWIPDKYRSTAVSRWVAYSLRMEFEAIYHPDYAIINNGGLRKAIPAGAVTLRDMHELLPFNNTVTVFSCYGRDLSAFEKLNALHSETRPHDICEISWPKYIPRDGLQVMQSPGFRDDRVGPRYEPDRVYRIVSHDYVVGQWDKYLGFKPFDVYDTGELILDAMLRQFEQQFGLSRDEDWD